MNLRSIGYGLVSFFTGVFLMMITLPIINNLTTALNTGTNATGDTIEAIIWIGVILVWLLSTIILPTYFIHVGAREEDKIPGFAKVIIGGLLFFFGILITYQSWFMITGISDAMDTTTLKTFFWIGLIINWIMLVIITPTYLIIEGTTNKT